MKRKRLFKHLDQSDRDRLEILWREGYNQVEIAKVLKVNKSTISREIRKRQRKNGIYDAATAQHKAKVKRANSKYQGMRVEANTALKQYIIENLKQYRSPDEISGRMKEEHQSFYAGKKAIYKWLYSSHGDGYCRYLCTKRHRRKKQKRDQSKRQMIPNRINISQRPVTPGLSHGEGDLMVSPRSAETSASVAMVCLPESQFLAGKKMRNRKPKTMTKTVNKIEQKIRVDTLTLDNGVENKDHHNFGVTTYFCDPHSPWQKPHIENNIGLLRRWFIPKKTDLSKLTERKLQKYIRTLNHKYRKSLGYRSAYEVAREHGILKTNNP